MHVVYVVSASDSDHFVELTAVSAASLRITNPDTEITLVTDEAFGGLATLGRKYLEATVNQIRVVEFGRSQSALERSRHLKCHLRQIIDGPFLYLDSDTLVFSDLGAINTMAHIPDLDIAAAADIESLNSTDKYGVFDHLEVMGWSVPTGTFLNAGVFYLADNLGAHRFAEAYIRFWRDFVRKVGKFNDQPAFNRAVNEVRQNLFELPSVFNAQILANPSLALDAKIIHYFTGFFDQREDTVGHLLAKQLKTTGGFDEGILAKAIASRNPWTRIDTVKKALSVRKSGYVVAAVGARSMLRRISRLQVKDIRSDIFQAIKALRS